MLLRFRKAIEEKDEGFTLIELLVVMIIIGILAAIAIPVFLAQRTNGYNTAAKNDVRNAATAIESAAVNKNGKYDAVVLAVPDPFPIAGVEFTASPGVTVTVQQVSATDYCLTSVNANGGQTWVYDKSAGGLQPETVVACA